MSAQHEQVIRLMELAYRAVDEPSQWQEFLSEFARTAGLKAATLAFQRGIDEPMQMDLRHGIDARFMAEYNERIVHVSPFLPKMAALPHKRMVGPGRIIVPRRELLRTEYYDWLDRLGVDDTLAAAEKTAERGMISLAGFTPTGEFVDDDHVELTRAIAPHLFHAVSLSRQMARLEAGRRVSRAALSRADFGCVFVDHRGRVEWMNECAERLLELGEALELDGRELRALHPRSEQRLEQAVRAALNLSAGERDAPEPIFCVERAGEGRPLEVLISPLRPCGPALFDELHGAMLLFTDPEHVEEGLAARLRELHGLTDTEAEVAQWLLAGTSTNEIAEIFDNSVYTIRTHVKRLLQKCNVSSQPELVGLLQRSVARLA
jgi:DNA-binding CsgD family transcriptional regulator